MIFKDLKVGDSFIPKEEIEKFLANPPEQNKPYGGYYLCVYEKVDEITAKFDWHTKKLEEEIEVIPTVLPA